MPQLHEWQILRDEAQRLAAVSLRSLRAPDERAAAEASRLASLSAAAKRRTGPRAPSGASLRAESLMLAMEGREDIKPPVPRSPAQAARSRASAPTPAKAATGAPVLGPAVRARMIEAHREQSAAQGAGRGGGEEPKPSASARILAAQGPSAASRKAGDGAAVWDRIRARASGKATEPQTESEATWARTFARLGWTK